MTKAEKTKSRIVETGLRLFGEKGYFNTTTKLIAKESGITEATLFKYFPDKPSLYLEIIQTTEPVNENYDEINSKLNYTDLILDHQILALAYIKIIFANIHFLRLLISRVATVPQHECEEVLSKHLLSHYLTYIDKACEVNLLPPKDYSLPCELFVTHMMRIVLDIAAHDFIYELDSTHEAQITQQLEQGMASYINEILTA